MTNNYIAQLSSKKDAKMGKFIVTIDSSYIRDAQYCKSGNTEDENGWKDCFHHAYLGLYFWDGEDVEGLVKYVSAIHACDPNTLNVINVEECYNECNNAFAKLFDFED